MSPKDDSYGKCYIVHHSTGCTCCSYQNYYEGLFLNRDQAQAFADSSADSTGLSSQYAPNGVHSVVELDYEIAGRWIVLNEGEIALPFFGFCDKGNADVEPSTYTVQRASI